MSDDSNYRVEPVIAIQSILAGLPYNEGVDLSSLNGNFIIYIGDGWAIDVEDNCMEVGGVVDHIGLFVGKVGVEALKSACERHYLDCTVEFKTFRYCDDVNNRLFIDLVLTDKNSGEVYDQDVIVCTAREMLNG
jgi:hypothetical protein